MKRDFYLQDFYILMIWLIAIGGSVGSYFAYQHDQVILSKNKECRAKGAAPVFTDRGYECWERKIKEESETPK